MSSLNNFCRYCGAKLPERPSNADASIMCTRCGRTNISQPSAGNNSNQYQAYSSDTGNNHAPPSNIGKILVAACVLGIILLGAMTKFQAARYLSLATEIAELSEKEDKPKALIEGLEEDCEKAMYAYFGSALWKTLILIVCFRVALIRFLHYCRRLFLEFFFPFLLKQLLEKVFFSFLYFLLFKRNFLLLNIGRLLIT